MAAQRHVLASLPPQRETLRADHLLLAAPVAPPTLQDACRALLASTAAGETARATAFWCMRINERLIPARPADQLAMLHLGTLQYWLGDQQAALQSWQAANGIDVYFALAGHSLNELNRRDEAMHFFNLSSAVSPRFHPRKFVMYNDLCISLREQGQLSEAITNCQYVTEVFSTANAYLALGRALFENGDYLSAQQAFALSLAKTAMPTTLAWQGRTSEALGELGEAEDYYKRSIELAPDYFWSHIYLGDLLASRARLEEAREQYYLALDLATEDTTTLVQFKIRQLEAEKAN